MLPDSPVETSQIYQSKSKWTWLFKERVEIVQVAGPGEIITGLAEESSQQLQIAPISVQNKNDRRVGHRGILTVPNQQIPECR